MGAWDESIIKMLKMFEEMTLSTIETLRTSDNAANIIEAAHSLKGAARSAGAIHLGNLSEKLQTAAETNQECSQLIEDTIKEFEKTCKEIKAL